MGDSQKQNTNTLQLASRNLGKHLSRRLEYSNDRSKSDREPGRHILLDYEPQPPLGIGANQGPDRDNKAQSAHSSRPESPVLEWDPTADIGTSSSPNWSAPSSSRRRSTEGDSTLSRIAKALTSNSGSNPSEDQKSQKELDQVAAGTPEPLYKARHFGSRSSISMIELGTMQSRRVAVPDSFVDKQDEIKQDDSSADPALFRDQSETKTKGISGISPPADLSRTSSDSQPLKLESSINSDDTENKTRAPSGSTVVNYLQNTNTDTATMARGEQSPSLVRRLSETISSTSTPWNLGSPSQKISEDSLHSDWRSDGLTKSEIEYNKKNEDESSSPHSYIIVEIIPRVKSYDKGVQVNIKSGNKAQPPTILTVNKAGEVVAPKVQTFDKEVQVHTLRSSNERQPPIILKVNKAIQTKEALLKPEPPREEEDSVPYFRSTGTQIDEGLLDRSKDLNATKVHRKTSSSSKHNLPGLRISKKKPTYAKIKKRPSSDIRKEPATSNSSSSGELSSTCEKLYNKGKITKELLELVVSHRSTHVKRLTKELRKLEKLNEFFNSIKVPESAQTLSPTTNSLQTSRNLEDKLDKLIDRFDLLTDFILSKEEKLKTARTQLSNNNAQRITANTDFGRRTVDYDWTSSGSRKPVTYLVPLNCYSYQTTDKSYEITGSHNAHAYDFEEEVKPLQPDSADVEQRAHAILDQLREARERRTEEKLMKMENQRRGPDLKRHDRSFKPAGSTLNNTNRRLKELNRKYRIYPTREQTSPSDK